MSKKIFIRHGDISFHPIPKAKGEVIKHNGSFAVELGETTGHAHRLTVKNKNDLVIKKDKNGNFYFELLSEGTITHEEHKSLTIPKGIYKKVKEREVDHFQGIVRQVLD